MPIISGIVLAAGAGTRHGGPKALVPGWLPEATDLLLAVGCAPVIVVLGARADEARGLVPADDRVSTIVAQHWSEGMGASLRAGLARATGDAVVVTLVDLPGTPPGVVRRLLDGGPDGDDETGPVSGPVSASLRQAVYAGRPGHPVLIGADHWASLVEQLHGDRGARAYLTAHGVVEIECGDLHHGRDEDR